MSIDGITTGSAALLAGGGLRVTDLQRGTKTAPAAAPVVEAASEAGADQAGAASGTSGGTRNMLAGNFFDANRGPSQYVAATVDAFGIADRMAQANANDLLSSLDQFGGITVARVYSAGDKTAGVGASENEIKSTLKRERDKELVEKADEEFRKEREAEKAAEKEAAGEAQGGSDQAATGDAGSAPAAAGATGAASPADDAGQGAASGATVEQTASADMAEAATAQEAASGEQSAAYVPVDILV